MLLNIVYPRSSLIACLRSVNK